MDLCIADIPSGCDVEILKDNGDVYVGRVIKNYGASIVIKAETGTYIIDGRDSQRVSFLNGDSEISFLANVKKNQEEFSALLKKLNREDK